MTIQEALDRRIPRIRQPQWAFPRAYIRLPLLADGKYGPWAELYDRRSQEAIGVAVGTQRLCVLYPEVANAEGFEVYTGIPDSAENENFAKAYLEE